MKVCFIPLTVSLVIDLNPPRCDVYGLSLGMVWMLRQRGASDANEMGAPVPFLGLVRRDERLELLGGIGAWKKHFV